MKITSVKVGLLRNKGKLQGIATIVVDDAIAIHDIRIIKDNDRIYCSMPRYTNKNHHCFENVHPTNVTARQIIEDTILAEYNKLTEAPTIS